MKVLTFFLLLVMAAPSFSLGIYKWIDEDGKKTYGNNPPENVLTDEVLLPEITIVAGETTYQEKSNLPPAVTPSISDQEASTNENKPAPNQTQQEAIVAGTIDIVAPQDDEAIRANNGNITLKFSVKPQLQKGESIIVYLDGKQQAISTTASVKLEYLDRGTHSLFVVRRGVNGEVVANSKNIKFHLLRHSKLF